jgi:eukaryotic-like serine/threonine-protein kinase
LSDYQENIDNEESTPKPFSKYRKQEDNIFKFDFNLNPKMLVPFVIIVFIFFMSLFLIFLLFDGVIMPALVHSKNVVTVPDISGKSFDEGLVQLSKANLAYKISHEIYSEEFPRRTIVKQVPYPGSEVKEGRTVYLTLSKGKETVAVPYLIGLPIGSARIELMKRGLELGEINYDFSETIGRDSIISQNITSSKYVPYGSAINIIVSQGSNATDPIPSLIGLWLNEVVAVIEENGFVLGNVNYQQSETFTPNTILGQNPPQGELHPKGTSIDITVSK